MSKLIVLIVVVALVYVFVLSPQLRSKVNATATNSIKELGTMAIDKITENSTSAVPTGQPYGQPATSPLTDFGKPSCKSTADCTQFGGNVTCDLTTGHCKG